MKAIKIYKALQAADDAADKVLQENLVTEPPVKITEIARNYGLLVEVVDLGKFGAKVAGFIEPKKEIIYVNKEDSPNRQAFTVAHELAHWLMHKDQLIKNPNKYAVLYRSPLGAPTEDVIEKEANAFAARVLVPKSILKDYKNQPVHTIASIFGVSDELINYRLKHEFNRQ